MKRFTKQRGTTPLLAWAVIVASLSPAAALAQNVPPARINTQSIHTSDGRPLFLRGFNRNNGVQPAAYEGGFFHFRSAQREQYQSGPLGGALDSGAVDSGAGHAQADQTDTLLPPMPDGAMPEEVVGQPEGPEPVIMDGGYGPDGGDYGPVDNGFFCSDCEKGKGKSGGVFDDWNWACLCLPLPPDDNFSVNAGVQAFKGPLNLGTDGSFGFHEGVNLGAAVPWVTLGIGWQFGVQGTQSNFGGQGWLSDDERNQVFVTAGFFRRVDCGLQGGVVVDYLRDEWFYDFSLSQIRAELSWVSGGCCEFGVFANMSNGEDTSEVSINSGQIDNLPLNDGDELTADATELFAIFYRHHFGDCGQTYGRIYLGITGDRGSILADFVDEGASAVIGADMHICLSDSWALETGFTYLPASDDGTVGFDDGDPIAIGALQESWNIGINLVWYPHGQTYGQCRSYYRPLFNVADNGSFLTHITGVNTGAN